MSSIFSHTSILNITIFKNERRIKMQRKPSLLYNLVCIRKNDSTHFVCHSDFEDDDIFTFETCIIVQYSKRKVNNCGAFIFWKKGSQASVYSVI